MATATLNLFPIQASSSSSSSSSSPTSCSCRTSSRLSFYSNLTRSRIFPSLSFKLTKSRSNSLSSSPIVSAHKKLSESDLITVPSEANEISGTFPSDSGVYAVFDKNNDLQFIGVSRSIAASVLSHRNSLPELCSSVKIGVVNDPDRTTLTEAWKSWMEEHIAATGKIPPGNESGNGIWIKRRPQKKSDLRLTPGRNKQLTVSLEDLIDRLVKENKVVAFIKGSRSAPLCGFSQRVVGILESQGIDYESVDVLDEEHNFGLRETLKSYSNWPTFPQIFVNGELVGGCDILVAMQESGELATLVKK